MFRIKKNGDMFGFKVILPYQLNNKLPFLY